jgi:hypothetical protein
LFEALDVLVEVLSFCKHQVVEFLAEDLFTEALKTFDVVSFDFIQWVLVAAIAELSLFLVERSNRDFIFLWSSFP